jgi:hypothetical protein
MAIVFPASPSVNDTFNEGSITYKWDGDKWIGLGITPADRLVEGSNKLEIDANNNLVYSGGNFAVGTSTANNTLTLYGDSSSSLRISKSGVLAYDHTFDGSTYTIANNNGSSGIDIVFGTKAAGGESLRINASGQLITKGRIFINNTNGGFDYNTTADTLEVLTTNGSTHSEFNNGSFVPSGSKNLGASGARWNTIYGNTINLATGIDFSSNDNAAGMSSEVLDDYEEGTFTPEIFGLTISSSYGHYVKVGSLVTCVFYIDVGTKTYIGSGSGTTSLQIILPFNNSNVTSAYAGLSIGNVRNIDFSSGSVKQFAMNIGGTNNRLTGRWIKHNSNFVDVLLGDLYNSFSIHASVTYQAA